MLGALSCGFWEQGLPWVSPASRSSCAAAVPSVPILPKPRRQEIVNHSRILISRALKSVKKTVGENSQEHANEVKSSAHTRGVSMPAPRRRIPAARRRWSGTRGSAVPAPSLPSLWILPRFPWDFFIFLIFFFSPHWSLMIFPARRELREDWR